MQGTHLISEEVKSSRNMSDKRTDLDPQRAREAGIDLNRTSNSDVYETHLENDENINESGPNTASSAATDTKYPDNQIPQEDEDPVSPAAVDKPSRIPHLSREAISDRANQLIDSLNDKRKQDTALLADMKSMMETQVERCYALMEQRMFSFYESQGELIQNKIQELFSVLENVSHIETELSDFREALSALYIDVQE